MKTAGKGPASRITALPSAQGQRVYTEAEAAMRGFGILPAVTDDMNDFASIDTFDRIVLGEMFERMTNWRSLLCPVHGWPQPDRRLFLHAFSHRSASYLFDASNKQDWIARHFFTGWIMRSHRLIRHVAEAFEVENGWRRSGEHPTRTARTWLEHDHAERNVQSV